MSLNPGKTAEKTAGASERENWRAGGTPDAQVHSVSSALLNSLQLCMPANFQHVPRQAPPLS